MVGMVTLIALSLIEYMESNELNRNGLAERLGVSLQYISKILSGKVNFSFKSIAELEQKLGIKLLDSDFFQNTFSVP